MRAFQRNESIKEEKHLSGTRLNMRQRKEKRENMGERPGNRKSGQFRSVVFKSWDLGRFVCSQLHNL